MSEDMIMLLVFGIAVLVILSMVIFSDTASDDELDISEEYPTSDYTVTFKDDP